MNKLSTEDFRRMIASAYEAVKAKADYFSELDAVTGDGDHGTAIVTALSAVNDAAKGDDFKTMLSDMGFGVMLNTSGSTSTLMGGFLLGMSDAVSGSELDTAAVKAMFRSGLEGVAKNTQAKVGDKTMMDALIPAVEAIANSSSDDIKVIMAEGAKAAKAGAEATIQMKANFGRARNYGERSVGTADAGASSWAEIFSAFAQAIQNE